MPQQLDFINPAKGKEITILQDKRQKRNVSERPVIRVSQVQPGMMEKALGKHITPVTLKTTIKSNPLYSDDFSEENWQERRNFPSWTVQDYDRHSLNSRLAHSLKENPNDLHFWLEDIYTPGYDTLLKKKERERKHARCCRIVLLLVLLLCVSIATVVLCILFT